MFDIEFLRDQSLLRWELRGFWSEVDAFEFKSALEKEMAQVRLIVPRFVCLSDTRNFPVQSGAIMQILSSMAQSTAAAGSRKLAILVSTALNSMQAERFLARDRVRVFRHEEEALRWLSEASDPPKP